MAKEFDIYLKRSVVACDLMVLSLPFRDGMTVDNRVILETCIEAYSLCKFVAAQTGSELSSHIDEMLKTCYEMLQTGYGIDADAQFKVHYSVYPEGSALEMSNSDISALTSMFMEANHAIGIHADNVMARIGKSIGSGQTAVALDPEVQNTLKRGFSKAVDTLILTSEPAETQKQGFLEAPVPVSLDAELSNLCYLVTNTVQSAVEFAAYVLGTEIHFSFGRGFSSLSIGANKLSGFVKHGFLETSSGPVVSADISMIREQNFESANSEVVLTSSLPTLFYRFHTGADGAMVLTAQAGDMEVKMSFGRAEGAVTLTADVPGTLLMRREAAQSTLVILSSLRESIYKVIDPKDAAVGLSADANAALYRKRMLLELDDEALSSMDGNTLSALSFIALSD